MDLLTWCFDAFVVFGGFSAILLGILELRDFKSSTLLFVILLFIIGIIQLSISLTLGGIVQASYLFFPLVFSVGPIAYLATNSMIDEDFRMNHLHALWLIFPLFAIILYGNMENSEIILWNIAGGSYFAFAIILARTLRSVNESKSKWVVRIFVLDSVLVGIFLFLSTWFNSIFFRIAQAWISLIVILLYFVIVKFPTMATAIRNDVRQAKYVRTRLNGLSKTDLIARLESLMLTTHLYRNESVSLSGVAEQMDLTTHQLSELINKEKQVGFFSFVNSYRIAEAKDLLLNTDKSALEIAFEVGFNNKSSFNEAFQKFTGTTPTQFRKDARVALRN